MVVVMPDAPWNDRGSWYTDSLYTGDATGAGAGTAVETAFTRDLVAHVDATYRTVEDREARAVGGYSMGARVRCGSRSPTRTRSPRASC